MTSKFMVNISKKFGVFYLFGYLCKRYEKEFGISFYGCGADERRPEG